MNMRGRTDRAGSGAAGSRRGVALIDAIIAAVILGVALSAIIGLGNQALNSQRVGEELRTAAMLADEQLNLVLARGPEYVASPGTYDQKHIDRIGRLHNCIAYGPGLLHLAHQPDEWVGVTDMIDSAKVMALVLADLLG